MGKSHGRINHPFLLGRARYIGAMNGGRECAERACVRNSFPKTSPAVIAVHSELEIRHHNNAWL